MDIAPEQPKLHILADQSVPFERVASQAALAPKGHSKLVGRGVNRLADDPAEFNSFRVTNLTVFPSLPMPNEAACHGFFLSLHVEVRVDGFVITTCGRPIPPEHGCTTPGVTICATRSAKTTLNAIRALERTATSEDAFRQMQHVLDGYDWGALHTRLVALDKEHPKDTILAFRAETEIPYGVVQRLFEVARWRMSVDGSGCADALTTEDLLRARPCLDSSGFFAELFPDPVTTVEP